MRPYAIAGVLFARQICFFFLINHADQLQYSNESTTVPVVIAMRINVVLELAPPNTKGR